MELKPFQQRVVEEKRDLDEKLEKLKKYIDFSEIYPCLIEAERNRLMEQCICMERYSEILSERIAAFNEEN